MNTTPPAWTHYQSVAAVVQPVWATAAVLVICGLAISAAAIHVNLLAEPMTKRTPSSKLGQERNYLKPAIAGMGYTQSATK